MRGYGTPILLALLAALGAPARAEKPKKDEAGFVEKALAAVSLGEPLQTEQVILIPLIAGEKPAPLGVMPDLGSGQVVYAEPPWPERRYNLSVTNTGSDPVLLFGGNVLVGGKLDRMLMRDVLLPGKQQIEIPTLPAQYPRERRKKPVPFRHAQALAPVYLRERALFDPSRYLVPIFISHFLEFRNEGDERHSLAAIDESLRLAKFCMACQEAVAAFPNVAEAKVVGFVTAVRGRVHCLELFGSNKLLRAYFHAIVKAHTYAAAAIRLRAKKVGIPLPGNGDPKAALAAATKASKALLEELERARYRPGDVPRSAIGETVLLRTRGSQGAAVGLEGRLVHATVFPHDPFEEALYSRPLEPPPEGTGREVAFGELERREGRGTLSEFEKRLLDRMRKRRGAGGPR